MNLIEFIKEKKYWIITGLIIFIASLILIYVLSFGNLIVETDPINSKIMIGKKFYSSFNKIRLAQGKYKITVSSETLLPKEITVNIKARQTTKISVDLIAEKEKGKPTVVVSGDDPVLTSNDHFSIDLPNDQDKKNYDFTITLYVVFNAGVNGPPIEEQESKYKQQLKAYKKEALDWLNSKGINSKNTKIKWIPTEAENL